jgi:hypothetical protein
MRKKESRPTESTSNRPKGNHCSANSTAPRRRRGPWPDAPLRRFSGWPAGLACYLGAGR